MVQKETPLTKHTSGVAEETRTKSGIIDRLRAPIVGNPDAVASRLDDLCQDAAVEIDRLRALAKSLSDALLTVRPLGGSEMFRKFGDIYYADPEYFKAQIEYDRVRYHEAMKDKVRAEKKLPALGDTHVVVRKDVDSAQSITRSKE